MYVHNLNLRLINSGYIIQISVNIREALITDVVREQPQISARLLDYFRLFVWIIYITADNDNVTENQLAQVDLIMT